MSTPPQPPASDPVVIKKYANRRLYNTGTSQYVTLDDLARLVHAGVEFTVADAKTGVDLTRSVLTQIIFEQEGRGEHLLPIQFLRQLISFYGGQGAAALPSYLQASLQAFSEGQERLLGTMASQNHLKTFEDVTRRNMELFSAAMSSFTPAFTPPAPARPQPDVDALRAQLDALQRQIEQLAQR